MIIRRGKHYYGEVFLESQDGRFYSLASDDVYVLEKGIIELEYNETIEFFYDGTIILENGESFREARLYLRFERSR